MEAMICEAVCITRSFRGSCSCGRLSVGWVMRVLMRVLMMVEECEVRPVFGPLRNLCGAPSLWFSIVVIDG